MSELSVSTVGGISSTLLLEASQLRAAWLLHSYSVYTTIIRRKVLGAKYDWVNKRVGSTTADDDASLNDNLLYNRRSTPIRKNVGNCLTVRKDSPPERPPGAHHLDNTTSPMTRRRLAPYKSIITLTNNTSFVTRFLRQYIPHIP